MDRAERIGLGVAIAAHLVLFAVLSFGLVPRDHPQRETVAVTLTDEIGEIATASDAPAPPAATQEFRELPTPTPPREELTPQPRIDPTPPPPRPSPTRTERPRQQTRPQRESRPDPRPRRRADERLDGITEGITPNATGSSPSQATVSASDRANLISRIVSAVRPCYNLGSLSGTAAEDIVVSLRLRPSRNGTISSGQISVSGYRGVTGANREYRRQMAEAARAAVLNPRCPFPNLPDEMYDNGWSDIVLNFVPAQLT